MSVRPGVLALVAVIVIGVAMIASGSGEPTRARPTATATAAAARHPASGRRRVAAAPQVDAARAYALAARNWTARSYTRSWRRQLTLTAGAYHRQLHAARPSRAQLAALEADAASSTATVTRVEADVRVRVPRARVVVWLVERTHAAGQTITGTTRNEVRLHRARDGRWRVTGWTALPGQEATP